MRRPKLPFRRRRPRPSPPPPQSSRQGLAPERPGDDFDWPTERFEWTPPSLAEQGRAGSEPPERAEAPPPTPAGPQPPPADPEPTPPAPEASAAPRAPTPAAPQPPSAAPEAPVPESKPAALPRLRRLGAGARDRLGGLGGPLATLGGRFKRLPRPPGRSLALVGAGLALLLAGGAGGYAISESGEEPAGPAPAPAPAVIVETGAAPQPEAAEEIGFPAFATRNTTRVGGADEVADAAGVALAAYPTFGGVGGPKAVTMAPADSWQAVLAAASLAADPIGAPILLGAADEIPGFTVEALTALAPRGIKRADGTALIAVGDVARPEGLAAVEIAGEDPAELARGIDRQRARLGGTRDPDNILVVSSEQPGFAMPAAAWAARAGDPIVFATEDEVPDATIDVLERHPRASLYVLGPEEVIGKGAMRKLRRRGRRVSRIEGDSPESNAIAFARFVDGGFGWNINDPGHGFLIANVERPADAGVAAPLALRGKPGPLLVTERSDEPSPELRDFFLDTKPGYVDDPSRAVYNHAWLMGDASAISLAFQAQVDELINLDRVQRGRGLPDFGVPLTEPEDE